MTDQLNDNAFTIRLSAPYEDALERVTAALKEEGFGVLTSIDVQQTLKDKIDVDFRKYAILGACNPTLANRALYSDPQIGLQLPCNVIVYEDEEAAGTIISVVNPLGTLGRHEAQEIQAVAAEAHAKLSRVASALAA